MEELHLVGDFAHRFLEKTLVTGELTLPDFISTSRIDIILGPEANFSYFNYFYLEYSQFIEFSEFMLNRAVFWENRSIKAEKIDQFHHHLTLYNKYKNFNIKFSLLPARKLQSIESGEMLTCLELKTEKRLELIFKGKFASPLSKFIKKKDIESFNTKISEKLEKSLLDLPECEFTNRLYQIANEIWYDVD